MTRLVTDDQHWLAELRSNPIVNRYINRPDSTTADQINGFIQTINQNINEGKSYYWKIVLTAQQAPIGTICLWRFSENRTTAEVGYELHPSFHRMGLAAEALGSVLQFAFNSLRLKSVDAVIHPQNEASKKLVIKTGFQHNTDRVIDEEPDLLVYELNDLSFKKSYISL
jgi:ribosomal-protein-alanine N-acetyltransferase